MPKVSLKNVTIIELLVAINRRYANIPALRIKEGNGFRSLTYIELGQRTADAAHRLKVLGVAKGDRVAILSESRPEWAVAFFGVVSAAGIVVPMDVKLSDPEITFILNDSGAKCVFTSKKYLATILRVKPELKELKSVICLDDVPDEGVSGLKDFAVPGREGASADIRPEDTALIVYTSGTTGVAKGVEITYTNLLFEVKALNDYIDFSPRDRFLSILPLNHLLELTGGMIAPLYAGACVTYCDSIKPPVLMKLMKETGTTTMICVPLVLKMFHNGIMKKVNDMKPGPKAMFHRLLQTSKYLLNFNVRVGKWLFRPLHRQFGGHLRCFVSGGAPLDPLVEEDFHAFGFNVLQGYGLTETSPVLSVNTFSQRKYASVGVPLKGVTVDIVKKEPADREGEIRVRGPNVMRGYFKNKEKTDEVLRDGWFHTGDIGYVDDDGFLYITGRMKNMIVLGAGKKIFPEEIEEVMSKSPMIREICVVGLKATSGLKAGTEEVFAVIIPETDAFEPSERENRDVVREKIAGELNRLSGRLAEYKRIAGFMIHADELPKTSTKKVKRKEVLEKIVIPSQGGS